MPSSSSMTTNAPPQLPPEIIAMIIARPELGAADLQAVLLASRAFEALARPIFEKKTLMAKTVSSIGSSSPKRRRIPPTRFRALRQSGLCSLRSVKEVAASGNWLLLLTRRKSRDFDGSDPLSLAISSFLTEALYLELHTISGDYSTRHWLPGVCASHVQAASLRVCPRKEFVAATILSEEAVPGGLEQKIRIFYLCEQPLIPTALGRYEGTPPMTEPSLDGIIACCSKESASVELVNILSDERQHVPAAPSKGEHRQLFLTDGQMLFGIIRTDKAHKLWGVNLKSGNRLFKRPVPEQTRILSCNHGLLLCSFASQHLHLLDASSGKLIRRCPIPRESQGKPGPFCDFPDNSVIQGEEIIVDRLSYPWIFWNLIDGSVRQADQGPPWSHPTLSGPYVAAACKDSVVLWDVGRRGSTPKRMRGALDLSQGTLLWKDGKLIAISQEHGSRDMINIWSTSPRKVRKRKAAARKSERPIDAPSDANGNVATRRMRPALFAATLACLLLLTCLAYRVFKPRLRQAYRSGALRAAIKLVGSLIGLITTLWLLAEQVARDKKGEDQRSSSAPRGSKSMPASSPAICKL